MPSGKSSADRISRAGARGGTEGEGDETMVPPRLSSVPDDEMTNNEKRGPATDQPEPRAPASERTGPPPRPLPANIATLPSADRREKLRVLEALLFAASEPLDVQHLASHLAAGDDVAALLTELQGFYASRGINLVRIAGKWAFRTADDLSFLLEKHATEERKLSKAALETLAIIAYHQPVTRAEIEEIRGVQTSKGTHDVLLETGWVRPRGRRRAPGKPITYGTTEGFLEHFNLDTVKDLPGLQELKGAGLLDSNRRPTSKSRNQLTLRP